MRLVSGACVMLFSFAVVSQGAAKGVHRTPLGSVVETSNAHVNSANAITGADIYACDTLDTADGGTIRVQLGASQIYLASLSGVTLDGNASQIRVLVNRGTTTFSLAASGGTTIETPAGILRGGNGQAAAGQVTIMGQELIVSAVRGDVVLDNAGELRTIPEGQSARVTFEGAPSVTCQESAAEQNQPKQALKHPKIGFFPIGVVATGLPAYFIWTELTESESKP